MTSFTIRLPDTQHERLKQLASERGVSMNKLFEELSARVIAEHDVEMRVRSRAMIGNATNGLKVIEQLDSAFSKP